MEESEKKSIIAEIEQKIKTSCSTSKYVQLCNRTQTAAGLAWVVNRCISLMSGENMKLNSALAQLESELEGMD